MPHDNDNDPDLRDSLQRYQDAMQELVEVPMTPEDDDAEAPAH